MRKRILSLLLCIVMCLQLVPITIVSAEGMWHCAQCDEWVDRDDICDECLYHKAECDVINHCPKCGSCLAGNARCDDCGLCADCIEDGDDNHCKWYFSCGYEGDVCDRCGMCKECEEEDPNYLCVLCGECTYGEACWDADDCPSGEWHCADCGISEWGCPGCDVCTYTEDEIYTYGTDDWHIECAIEAGILCWYCKEEEPTCDACGLCDACIEDLMQHCLICDQCYIDVDPCETYGQDHCQDHCVLCEMCDTCYLFAEDELCPDCGLCPDCTSYCESCGSCMSEFCDGQCEDGGDHCPDCCEICDECGLCMIAFGYESCDYCGYCETCCAENACEDCGLCAMYDNFDNHKCENCGECVPDEEPCEFCGLCVNCCEDNACDECGLCVENPDYDDHFCPECGSCMGDEDPCDDCGLCEDCCAEKACEYCGMCIENSDYEDHICPECGSCTDEYDHCPDCGLCERCCIEASECSEYLCVESSEYDEHFCEICNQCFHEVIQCETCDAKGIAVCIDCCNTFGHAGVPGGTQKASDPEILQQPEDAHAVVSDVQCYNNGVYKNHGIAPEDNFVTFSVKIEKPYGVSFKWQQKWVNGWHDLEDGEYFQGTDTDTLTAQVAADECINPAIYRCVVTNLSGSTYSNEVKIIAEHYYNVWYAAEWRESTDVPAGYHVLMCCGDGGCEEWKPKTKAKHDYTWTVLEAPTADKKGKNQGVCSVCGYKTVVETPMNHEHQWMWSLENNHYACAITGCTETTIRYVCDKCNNVPLDQITKIWVMDDKNPKDHYLACSACHRTLVSQAHNFSDPEVIQEATENARGITRQTCGCGYEKNEYTPKLPHTHDFISNPLDVGDYGGINYNSAENNYKLQHSYNENSHWKICLKKVSGKTCGHIYAQEAHNFVINTAKTSMDNPVSGGQQISLICMQCGYETTETVPSGESGYLLSIRNAKARVFTADGMVRDNAYWAKPGETVEVVPTPTIGRTITLWMVSGDADTLRSAGYKVNGLRQLMDANNKLIVRQKITFIMGNASVGLNGSTVSCSHSNGEDLKINYNENEHWGKCESCGMRTVDRESHSFTTDENGVTTCDVCGYSYYDVWFDGKPFDSISLTKTSNGGTATYDPITRTLLLNNYSDSSTAAKLFPVDATGLTETIWAMLYSPHDLTIVLTGSNQFNRAYSLGNSVQHGVAMFVDGNLIIGGSGSLSVNTNNDQATYGLYATGDVTNSSSVTFQMDATDREPAEALYGVYALGSFTNNDNGILNVQTGHSISKNIALYADSVLNNGELNAISKCSQKGGFGIYAENSVINNGKISADAYYGTIGRGYAIHTPQLKINGNTHLMGDATVLHEVTSLSIDSGLIIEGSEEIADDWELTVIDQSKLSQMKTASILGTKSYGVWIGQQQFADGSLTIRIGEGTATYSPKTGILTLNNVVSTTMCDAPMYGASYGIYCDSDNAFSPELLTINLVGENAIRLNGADAGESWVVGVNSNGLQLTGDGALTIDINTSGTDKNCTGLFNGNTVVNEAVIKMNLKGDKYLSGIECNLENRGRIQIDATSAGSCYGFYADRLINAGSFQATVTSTTAGEDAVALELTDEAQNRGKIIVSAISEGASGIGINAAETIYNTGSIRASGTKQAIWANYPIYFAQSGADDSNSADYVISGGGAFGQSENSFASAMWMNKNYVLSANNKVIAKEIEIRSAKTSVFGRVGAVGSPVTCMVKGNVPESARLYAACYKDNKLVEVKIITDIVTDEQINTGLTVIDGLTCKLMLLDENISPLCNAWASNK